MSSLGITSFRPPLPLSSDFLPDPQRPVPPDTSIRTTEEKELPQRALVPSQPKTSLAHLDLQNSTRARSIDNEQQLHRRKSVHDQVLPFIPPGPPPPLPTLIKQRYELSTLQSPQLKPALPPKPPELQNGVNAEHPIWADVNQRSLIDQNNHTYLDGPNVLCAPTAVAMILKDRGKDIDISKLASAAKTKEGTHFGDLLPAMRAFGITSATLSRQDEIYRLKRGVAGGPAIAVVTVPSVDSTHVVIVDAIRKIGDKEFVLIRDPDGGKREVWPMEKFETRYLEHKCVLYTDSFESKAVRTRSPGEKFFTAQALDASNPKDMDLLMSNAETVLNDTVR